MSDTIGIMRDGKIVQMGSPEELYDAPLNRYVADFVGESNFLKGQVAASDSEGAALTIESGITLRAAHSRLGQRLTVGEPGVIAVRPEVIGLYRADEAPIDVGVDPDRHALARHRTGGQRARIEFDPARWKLDTAGRRQRLDFDPRTEWRQGPLEFLLRHVDQRGRRHGVQRLADRHPRRATPRDLRPAQPLVHADPMRDGAAFEGGLCPGRVEPPQRQHAQMLHLRHITPLDVRDVAKQDVGPRGDGGRVQAHRDCMRIGLGRRRSGRRRSVPAAPLIRLRKL